MGGSDRTYSFDVPSDFGGLILEAFVDTNGDGPGPGRFNGNIPRQSLTIQSDDINDINITLSVPADGKMPSTPSLRQNNLRSVMGILVHQHLMSKMYRLSE